MRILFTGASSFTGHWFVLELAERGHEVTAVLRRPAEAYEGVRGDRVRGLEGRCRTVHGPSFGDEAFLDVIGSGEFELLCHHAAEVTDYRSPEFDVAAALENNTKNLRAVLAALADGGCRRVLLTGSVFETGEGAGSGGLPAFSPYGLSKALTSQVFEYYAKAAGVTLGKFVIPNPFGPLEEPRFTSYLARTWLAGEAASVRTPAYVRDNIHVSLLAKAYASFVEYRAWDEPGTLRMAPSGYVETQGEFARRMSRELGPRLGRECAVTLGRQEDWSEPAVRVNTDVLPADVLGWDEGAAWDELAAWYGETFGE